MNFACRQQKLESGFWILCFRAAASGIPVVVPNQAPFGGSPLIYDPILQHTCLGGSRECRGFWLLGFLQVLKPQKTLGTLKPTPTLGGSWAVTSRVLSTLSKSGSKQVRSIVNPQP